MKCNFLIGFGLQDVLNKSFLLNATCRIRWLLSWRTCTLCIHESYPICINSCWCVTVKPITGELLKDGTSCSFVTESLGVVTFHWETCAVLHRTHVALVSTGQQCQPTRQIGGQEPVKDLPETTQTPGQNHPLFPHHHSLNSWSSAKGAGTAFSEMHVWIGYTCALLVMVILR